MSLTIRVYDRHLPQDISTKYLVLSLLGRKRSDLRSVFRLFSPVVSAAKTLLSSGAGVRRQVALDLHNAGLGGKNRRTARQRCTAGVPLPQEPTDAN